ncbi:MAG: 50S ribosomal protein L29 [Deltaproteobacteria bacterium]|nr:50S ribosomal protein L29 [Deltaproteobacteria bacterium]MBW2120738.1 50S ribosomal protein L29 [Deltaproteobacteria bacterium]
MKASDLRDLSLDELKGKEKDLKEELFNLRFQHATGQLENTMRIPQVKKDLARVKTILRERAGESAPEGETSNRK